MNTALKIESQLAENIILKGKKPIVIIGSGPVGMRFVNELVQYSEQHPIVIYGDESWLPYNRVRLSSLLAGDVTPEDILISAADTDSSLLIKRFNCKVTSIDRENKLITDEYGQTQEYEKLILAMGSSPFIPDIPGIDLEGIYQFRDMNDTEKLIARRTRSRHTVVLGGGLLGLEAARAMQRFSTRVSVIEHNRHLLFRQLDETAAELFRVHVDSMGIDTYLHNSVKAIHGDSENRVNSIELRSGKTLACDTLIVSTGIRPNISLARDAKLRFGRGIKVNDEMQTSDPDIYAIGECCEHQGEVYGIVAPGYEQAAIAARNIARIPGQYKGTVLATSLKVVGLPVFSMGDVDESTRTYTQYVYQKDGIYRRLNVYRGQLLGVIAIGEWTALIQLKEHVKKGKLLFPWHLKRFTDTGELWESDSLEQVNLWPAEATICSCNGLSRGYLSKEIENGCRTVQTLAEKTGASTVCGSCKPLLVNMLGQKEIEPVRAWKPLWYGSALFFVMCVIAYLFPAVPYNSTVQVPWRWDMLWTESLFKQVSGFTLLGMTVLVLILSLRKRMNWFSLGDFPIWRLLHALLGGSAIFVLLVHTGFRLGDNINFMLMMSFTSLLLAGTVVGSVIALEHKLEASTVRQVRSIGNWLHIILFWPIPVLLGFHIFKTYYY